MYVDLMDANIKIGRLCIFQREGFFLNLRKKNTLICLVQKKGTI